MRKKVLVRSLMAVLCSAALAVPLSGCGGGNGDILEIEDAIETGDPGDGGNEAVDDDPIGALTFIPGTLYLPAEGMENAQLTPTILQAIAQFVVAEAQASSLSELLSAAAIPLGTKFFISRLAAEDQQVDITSAVEITSRSYSINAEAALKKVLADSQFADVSTLADSRLALRMVAEGNFDLRAPLAFDPAQNEEVESSPLSELLIRFVEQEALSADRGAAAFFNALSAAEMRVVRNDFTKFINDLYVLSGQQSRLNLSNLDEARQTLEEDGASDRVTESMTLAVTEEADEALRDRLLGEYNYLAMQIATNGYETEYRHNLRNYTVTAGDSASATQFAVTKAETQVYDQNIEDGIDDARFESGDVANATEDGLKAYVTGNGKVSADGSILYSVAQQVSIIDRIDEPYRVLEIINPLVDRVGYSPANVKFTASRFASSRFCDEAKGCGDVSKGELTGRSTEGNFDLAAPVLESPFLPGKLTGEYGLLLFEVGVEGSDIGVSGVDAVTSFSGGVGGSDFRFKEVELLLNGGFSVDRYESSFNKSIDLRVEVPPLAAYQFPLSNGLIDIVWKDGDDNGHLRGFVADSDADLFFGISAPICQDADALTDARVACQTVQEEPDEAGFIEAALISGQVFNNIEMDGEQPKLAMSSLMIGMRLPTEVPDLDGNRYRLRGIGVNFNNNGEFFVDTVGQGSIVFDGSTPEISIAIQSFARFQDGQNVILESSGYQDSAEAFKFDGTQPGRFSMTLPDPDDGLALEARGFVSGDADNQHIAILVEPRGRELEDGTYEEGGYFILFGSLVD